MNKPSYEVPEESKKSESSSFDLFAKPEVDHLQEELARGSYQWTNKFTKVLMSALIIVSLLSAGAWYGHRSTAARGTTSISGASAFASGFGNRNQNSPTATGVLPTGAPDAAAVGGFGGGNRITGKVSKVSGSSITITLDDPSQAASLKAGDTTRLSTTTGGPSQQIPAPDSSANTSTTTKSSNTKAKPGAKSATPSANPTIAGGVRGQGQAGGGGRFNNPELTACLAKEGVVIEAGTRPDRADPKIAAAMQKCFPAGGMGGPGGQNGGTN